ncbi:MAG TPA: hypothetical protein VK211_19345 [Kamptonema sp.]|nr:hypothetical protein [Kamptonema sp.]
MQATLKVCPLAKGGNEEDFFREKAIAIHRLILEKRDRTPSPITILSKT